jgi:hypothetical protein
VEDCQNESRACRASTMSNVRGFGHTSRSLLLTQRQPRTVGRAITKLTFSPRKESMNTVVEKPHETVKRDWRSMYAASPCAYKRSCHRSTTPKFDSANFSLAANYLQTNGASGCPLASPVIQDHQPGIANSRCKTPKSSISLQASLSRLPPRYSACEAVSQVLPANQRAWHKTNYTG